MTVLEAIQEISALGTVRYTGGENLLVALPRSKKSFLKAAVDTLRTNKAEAIAILATNAAAADPDEPWLAEVQAASVVLGRAGVRLLDDHRRSVGVWSDQDSADVRQALAVMGVSRQPVRYLDGPGIPDRFRVRRVPGEPVPLSVLVAMQQASAEPWMMRDRMLYEMGRGVDGQPGRITAERCGTVSERRETKLGLE